MGDSRYQTQSLQLQRSHVTARTRTIEMTLPSFIHSFLRRLDDSIEPYWLSKPVSWIKKGCNFEAGDLHSSYNFLN